MTDEEYGDEVRTKYVMLKVNIYVLQNSLSADLTQLTLERKFTVIIKITDSFREE